jgi:hypothetical protein
MTINKPVRNVESELEDAFSEWPRVNEQNSMPLWQELDIIRRATTALVTSYHREIWMMVERTLLKDSSDTAVC